MEEDRTVHVEWEPNYHHGYPRYPLQYENVPHHETVYGQNDSESIACKEPESIYETIEQPDESYKAEDAWRSSRRETQAPMSPNRLTMSRLAVKQEDVWRSSVKGKQTSLSPDSSNMSRLPVKEKDVWRSPRREQETPASNRSTKAQLAIKEEDAWKLSRREEETPASANSSIMSSLSVKEKGTWGSSKREGETPASPKRSSISRLPVKEDDALRSPRRDKVTLASNSSTLIQLAVKRKLSTSDSTVSGTEDNGDDMSLTAKMDDSDIGDYGGGYTYGGDRLEIISQGSRMVNLQGCVDSDFNLSLESVYPCYIENDQFDISSNHSGGTYTCIPDEDRDDFGPDPDPVYDVPLKYYDESRYQAVDREDELDHELTKELCDDLQFMPLCGVLYDRASIQSRTSDLDYQSNDNDEMIYENINDNDGKSLYDEVNQTFEPKANITDVKYVDMGDMDMSQCRDPQMVKRGGNFPHKYNKYDNGKEDNYTGKEIVDTLLAKNKQEFCDVLDAFTYDQTSVGKLENLPDVTIVSEDVLKAKEEMEPDDEIPAEGDVLYLSTRLHQDDTSHNITESDGNYSTLKYKSSLVKKRASDPVYSNIKKKKSVSFPDDDQYSNSFHDKTITDNNLDKNSSLSDMKTNDSISLDPPPMNHANDNSSFDMAHRKYEEIKTDIRVLPRYERDEAYTLDVIKDSKPCLYNAIANINLDPRREGLSPNSNNVVASNIHSNKIKQIGTNSDDIDSSSNTVCGNFDQISHEKVSENEDDFQDFMNDDKQDMFQKLDITDAHNSQAMKDNLITEKTVILDEAETKSQFDFNIQRMTNESQQMNGSSLNEHGEHIAECSRLSGMTHPNQINTLVEQTFCITGYKAGEYGVECDEENNSTITDMIQFEHPSQMHRDKEPIYVNVCPSRITENKQLHDDQAYGNCSQSDYEINLEPAAVVEDIDGGNQEGSIQSRISSLSLDNKDTSSPNLIAITESDFTIDESGDTNSVSEESEFGDQDLSDQNPQLFDLHESGDDSDIDISGSHENLIYFNDISGVYFEDKAGLDLDQQQQGSDTSDYSDISDNNNNYQSYIEQTVLDYDRETEDVCEYSVRDDIVYFTVPQYTVEVELEWSGHQWEWVSGANWSGNVIISTKFS